MSWQNFVEESLLGTSQVARAAIHGLDGKRYASSAGFVVLPSEAQALISGITKDPSPFYSKGIAVNRTKYIFVRSDPGHAIYCRKGKEGVVAVKTNKCLLIGGYTDGMQAGWCSAVIEKLANYFIAIGY
ncbi:profilin-2-like [Stylophora pistillata]|uniref:Profilin n=1 Tax=Stylophora pistillata TaxID=50429 RepID=A0A2B4S792_STYPI|nr:profilin-2-like [Stylophora pistillata]PFX25771.1 Profilin-1A [Stylophora pistillata]